MRKHSPGPDHQKSLISEKRDIPMTKASNDTKSTHESFTDDCEGRTTVTRRLAMNMIASTATFTSAAALAAPASDPIFAAIEAHKMAYANLVAIVEAHSLLESELPREKRRSNVSVWEENIVEADDPRWIDNERAFLRAADAEEDAAMELINAEPTTVAVAAALLKHVVAMEAKGWGWPSGLQEDEAKPTPIGKNWEVFLHRNLAELLSKAA
jgi:hypothetical protein